MVGLWSLEVLPFYTCVNRCLWGLEQVIAVMLSEEAEQALSVESFSDQLASGLWCII